MTHPDLKPDDFHAHLDACTQCRNNPFALCRTGARLLEKAVSEADAILGDPANVIITRTPDGER